MNVILRYFEKLTTVLWRRTAKRKKPYILPVIPPRSTVSSPLLNEAMERLERAVGNGVQTNAHWRIVHVHVPKTAGSAFSDTFKTVFEDSVHLGWDKGAAQWRQIVEKGRLARFTTGHIRASDVLFDQRTALQPIQMVTIVRHPLDRAVSAYNYGCSTRYPGHAAFSRSFPDLGSYIERMTERPNYQSRWIGHYIVYPRMMFSVIGRYYMGIATLEHIDDYAVALQTALSPRRLFPIMRVNEGRASTDKAPASKNDLHSDAVERFMTANALDLELYEAVGEQWARRRNNLC